MRHGDTFQAVGGVAHYLPGYGRAVRFRRCRRGVGRGGRRRPAVGGPHLPGCPDRGGRPPAAAGIPRGDYNGRDRGGPDGVVSLLQTTTRRGKRSSTYHAFLEGDVEQRPNLEVICGAHVTRVILEGGPGELRATGVEYRTADG